MTIFYMIWAFVFGLGIGMLVLGKGLNINITHKHEQPQQPEKKKVEYNESLAGLLPAEVQQYYQQTQGQNRF